MLLGTEKCFSAQLYLSVYIHTVQRKNENPAEKCFIIEDKCCSQMRKMIGEKKNAFKYIYSFFETISPIVKGIIPMVFHFSARRICI